MAIQRLLDVSTSCAAYNRMAESWVLVDALLGGTQAMRDKAQQYLPPASAEAKEAYGNRLRSSFLKPFFRNAVENAKGAVFRYDVNTSGVVDQFDDILDDIDLLGNDLTTFLAAAFRDMLSYGHCHLLAAYPQLPSESTLADARALAVRPYAVRLDPRNVFSWKKSVIDGREFLEEVRFFEDVPSPTSEWDTDTTERRIKVLRPGEWQEWSRSDAGGNTVEWVMVDSGRTTLDFVPLATIYGDRIDFMISRPPFLDLAWLNLAHWQSYSDYRNILHIAQVPFLFASGMKADESGVIIGTSSAVVAEDPAAKMMWVEHSGAAIASGRQEILDLESAMEAMGAALMSEETPGNETATAKSIETSNQQASLGGLVRALQDGANQFLWLMAQWLRIDDPGKIEIRRPISMGGTESVISDGQEQASEMPMQMNGALQEPSQATEPVRNLING